MALERQSQANVSPAMQIELDNVYSELRRLQKVVGVPEVAQPKDAEFVSYVQIEAKESDGTPDIFVDGIELDQATGWALSESVNLAKISRAADATAPTAQSVAGTAGTSQKQANLDHAHAPVVTTKGDVLGYSTLPARVPVGTNNQVLTADSAQALGVKWATPAAGGTTVPVWRCREYYAGIGSNLVLDSSWFKIP